MRGRQGWASCANSSGPGTTRPSCAQERVQRDLIAKAVTELHLPRGLVLGSAPFALESALRAMAGLTIDGSGVEVCLRVVGVPPQAAVVAWEEATAYGQPLSSQMPPHGIAGLTARIPGLWPPGPFALAAAAARVVEAIALGSRRRFSCFVATEAGPAASRGGIHAGRARTARSRARARARAYAARENGARERARESLKSDVATSHLVRTSLRTSETSQLSFELPLRASDFALPHFRLQRQTSDFLPTSPTSDSRLLTRGRAASRRPRSPRGARAASAGRGAAATSASAA